MRLLRLLWLLRLRCWLCLLCLLSGHAVHWLREILLRWLGSRNDRRRSVRLGLLLDADFRCCRYRWLSKIKHWLRDLFVCIVRSREIKDRMLVRWI